MPCLEFAGAAHLDGGKLGMEGGLNYLVSRGALEASKPGEVHWKSPEPQDQMQEIVFKEETCMEQQIFPLDWWLARRKQATVLVWHLPNA